MNPTPKEIFRKIIGFPKGTFVKWKDGTRTEYGIVVGPFSWEREASTVVPLLTNMKPTYSPVTGIMNDRLKVWHPREKTLLKKGVDLAEVVREFGLEV